MPSNTKHTCQCQAIPSIQAKIKRTPMPSIQAYRPKSSIHANAKHQAYMLMPSIKPKSSIHMPSIQAYKPISTMQNQASLVTQANKSCKLSYFELIHQAFSSLSCQLLVTLVSDLQKLQHTITLWRCVRN
ncbi:unnamed protein product [Prunus armeniaca]